MESTPAAPQGDHVEYWVIAVPVLGVLIVGLMARFGSERIGGLCATVGMAAMTGGTMWAPLSAEVFACERPVSVIYRIAQGDSCLNQPSAPHPYAQDNTAEIPHCCPRGLDDADSSLR